MQAAAYMCAAALPAVEALIKFTPEFVNGPVLCIIIKFTNVTKFYVRGGGPDIDRSIRGLGGMPREGGPI